MESWVADRLARRLKQGGAWRVLAPWLRRRVIRAGYAGDQNAIDAAWQVWLARPDQKLWRALERWGRSASDRTGDRGYWPSRVALRAGPAAAPREVAQAASRAGHPISRIAREQILAAAHDTELVDAVCEEALAAPAASGLARWCAGHGLAPSGAVARTAFFLLTGQTSQYRAADPDGSLTAVAYQAASDAERERLRAAMAGAGDLDLVRALAVTPGSRARPMAAGEAGYLSARLAGRQDWARLWRLAQDMPLADAVAAVSQFPDDWRPAGAPEFFGRLAQADPQEISSSRGALLASSLRQLTMTGHVIAGSMSCDGRQLAVARLDRGVQLDVIDLQGLAVVGSGYLGSSWDGGLLHLGEAVLSWNQHGWQGVPDRHRHVVYRSAADETDSACLRQTKLFPGERFEAGGFVRFDGAVCCPGGFAALLNPDWDGPKSLRFATASGEIIRHVPVHKLGMGPGTTLAGADPGSGRLVLATGPASGLLRKHLCIVDGDPARSPRVIPP